MKRRCTKDQSQKGLKSLEDFCAQSGARLTDPRRHVFEIIAQSAKPMGAYDILEALGAYIDNPKPPTAYRAIEFLQENGFIHRIESLNAYIFCDTDHRHTGSQFLICDGCGSVTEAHMCHVPKELMTNVETQGFVLARWDVEIHGLCAACASKR